MDWKMTTDETFTTDEAQVLDDLVSAAVEWNAGSTSAVTRAKNGSIIGVYSVADITPPLTLDDYEPMDPQWVGHVVRVGPPVDVIIGVAALPTLSIEVER